MLSGGDDALRRGSLAQVQVLAQMLDDHPPPSGDTKRTRLPVFQADLRLVGERPLLPPGSGLMQELETSLGGTGG